MNSFTIDQCVEQINARLAQEGLPATMNVRLLRHYQQNKSIYQIVVTERKLITQEKWDEVFTPENLLRPSFIR